MKKLAICLTALILLGCATAALASEALLKTEFGSVETVVGIRDKRDGSWVVLQGTIGKVLSHKRYTMVDATGEVVLEIDRKILGEYAIDVGDDLIVSGTVDRDDGSMEIEVKALSSPGFSTKYVTVAQAKRMRDDDWVVMKGYVKSHAGQNKYRFADESGAEIVAEINRGVLDGRTFKPGELVEIRGEMDIDGKGRDPEVDVEFIRKL